ncbi:ATP-binding protein [Salipaludibacillus sp. HK11]|uniref:sensor histidine kinase n=1 Tax=Salipaludibacillus sp. HK11 TaxID=3394320 RepID=UPI0039FC86C0
MNAELERTQNQSRTIVEALQPSSADWRPAEYLRAYVSGDGMVRVINENEEIVLVVISRTPQLNELQATFSTHETSEKINYNGTSYAVARTPVIWDNGSVVTLELFEPMTMYEESLTILGIILVIASALILIPSFFAGRSLSRVILSPVKALVVTMNQIREEKTFKKIDVNDTSKDELAEMGRTFNHMIDLLKENYDKQQQFVSDASHELKTPLTVIDSYAQLLKRWGKDKPEVLEEAIGAISSESKRIKEMTNQMLALATGDETTTMDLQQVNMAKILFETAKQMETTYDREIAVQTKEEFDLRLIGNKMQLKQLAFILIENGLKYSNKEIEITLEKLRETVSIRICDYGIGIAAEDIPHVFDRFFRVDKARNRKTGGSGLGLAIAKKIVDAHQGVIRVESEQGVGTTFIIEFPGIETEGDFDE